MCLLGIHFFLRPTESRADSAADFPSTSEDDVSDSQAELQRASNDGEASATNQRSKLSGSNEVATYLPADLRYLHLGLTLEEFMDLEPDLNYEVFGEVRLETTKKILTGGITEFTAYFDIQKPHTYYELIVIFATKAQRDQSAQALLGQPNFESGWLLPLEDGKAIHAWTAFEDKLVYKFLLGGPSSVYDDRPTADQIEELQENLNKLQELLRNQGSQK